MYEFGHQIHLSIFISSSLPLVNGFQSTLVLMNQYSLDTLSMSTLYLLCLWILFLSTFFLFMSLCILLSFYVYVYDLLLCIVLFLLPWNLSLLTVVLLPFIKRYISPFASKKKKHINFWEQILLTFSIIQYIVQD